MIRRQEITVRTWIDLAGCEKFDYGTQPVRDRARSDWDDDLAELLESMGETR